VKVIAFEVDHGDAIKPAYGYRIEYDGRAVVISGDTRFNQNVIKYGAGADMLAAGAAGGTTHPAHYGAPHDGQRSGQGVCPNQT
jgi:ribonuclease BN (tRNA processing enzyme)